MGSKVTELVVMEAPCPTHELVDPLGVVGVIGVMHASACGEHRRMVANGHIAITDHGARTSRDSDNPKSLWFSQQSQWS